MVAAVALSLPVCAGAEMESPRALVILLQPTIVSPGTHRSLERIKDELLADRFRVVLADSSVAGDPGAVMESLARERDAVAVLALFGDPESGQSELWIVQRGSGRAVVRRATVTVDPERMPEVLSLRALELLRATALELSLETESPSQSSTPGAISRPAAPAPPPAPLPEPSPVIGDVLSVETGVAVLHSLDGPPPAVAPVGRVRVRFLRSMHARVTVSGLGSRPRFETQYGSATVAHSFALLELGALFRRDKRIRPLVILGAGALNVNAGGTGKGQFEGRELGKWCAIFDAGAGGSVGLGSRLALATELHAFIASPHPVVRFVGMPVATIGRPSLVLTLTLEVAL
jgi:hypothetical protein